MYNRIYERNQRIYDSFLKGVSKEKLARRYNVSTQTVSRIITRFNREDELDNDFYKAIKKAGVKLEGIHIATKTYNTLAINGIIPHILDGTIDLDDYSDEELRSFDGIGPKTVELIRAAWSIYKYNNVPRQMSISDSKLHGYLTGNDLIHLIYSNNLGNKQVCSDKDTLDFIIHKVDLDSEDPNDRYFEMCSIDLKTGKLQTVKDYVD